MVTSPGSTQPSTPVKIVVAVFVALAPVWVAVIVVTSVQPQPLTDYGLLGLSSVALLVALFVVQGLRRTLRRIEEEKARQRQWLPGGAPLLRLRWRLPFTGPPMVRGLSLGPKVAILSAVCVGTLAILSTFPILSGLPAAGARPDDDSCEYRVGQRATETCVTRIEYERFTLAGQRSSAGLNLIVSALLAGALLNRTHRSGRPGGTPRPAAGPPMPDIDPGPDVDTILRRSS